MCSIKNVSNTDIHVLEHHGLLLCRSMHDDAQRFTVVLLELQVLIGCGWVHFEGGANSKSFCISLFGEYWNAHKCAIFVGAHGHSAGISGSCHNLQDHCGYCSCQSFWLQRQKCLPCEFSFPSTYEETWNLFETEYQIILQPAIKSFYSMKASVIVYSCYQLILMVSIRKGAWSAFWNALCTGGYVPCSNWRICIYTFEPCFQPPSYTGTSYMVMFWTLSKVKFHIMPENWS